jgi:hypothetical protein
MQGSPLADAMKSPSPAEVKTQSELNKQLGQITDSLAAQSLLELGEK